MVYPLLLKKIKNKGIIIINNKPKKIRARILNSFTASSMTVGWDTH